MTKTFQAKFEITFKQSKDIELPIILADKEIINLYLSYRDQRDQILKEIEENKEDAKIIDRLTKIYKELKSRTSTFERSFYFKCEETGEIKLLRAVVMHDGKAVTFKVYRKIVKDNEIKDKEIADQTMKAIQETGNTSLFDNLTERQKMHYRAKVEQMREQLRRQQQVQGTSNLEIALKRGRVKWEDVETAKNFNKWPMNDKEIDHVNRIYHTYLSSHGEKISKKFAMHDLILERARSLDSNRYAEKMLEKFFKTDLAEMGIDPKKFYRKNKPKNS